MYLCRNTQNVTRFAAIIQFTACGLPVWFAVEVFATDHETAGFIFAAFHGLETFELVEVERTETFTFHLN